jgi:quinol monooxygenase YgiN
MKVLKRLERERDEAREALREMWRSGDAFLPHVDSETINRWRKAAGWDGTK